MNPPKIIQGYAERECVEIGDKVIPLCGLCLDTDGPCRKRLGHFGPCAYKLTILEKLLRIFF